MNTPQRVLRCFPNKFIELYNNQDATVHTIVNSIASGMSMFDVITQLVYNQIEMTSRIEQLLNNSTPQIIVKMEDKPIFDLKNKAVYITNATDSYALQKYAVSQGYEWMDGDKIKQDIPTTSIYFYFNEHKWIQVGNPTFPHWNVEIILNYNQINHLVESINTFNSNEEDRLLNDKESQNL